VFAIPRAFLAPGDSSAALRPAPSPNLQQKHMIRQEYTLHSLIGEVCKLSLTRHPIEYFK